MDIFFIVAALLGRLLYFRRGVVFLFLANRAFARKDEVKTLAWFEEAWKIRQLDPGMVTAYAYQLLEKGDLELAEKVWVEARDWAPTGKVILGNLGAPGLAREPQPKRHSAVDRCHRGVGRDGLDIVDHKPGSLKQTLGGALVQQLRLLVFLAKARGADLRNP
ncbi:MAG: hypothetical protein WCG80_03950 [Spirochaetales bacterium]